MDTREAVRQTIMRCTVGCLTDALPIYYCRWIPNAADCGDDRQEAKAPTHEIEIKRLNMMHAISQEMLPAVDTK